MIYGPVCPGTIWHSRRLQGGLSEFSLRGRHGGRGPEIVAGRVPGATPSCRFGKERLNGLNLAAHRANLALRERLAGGLVKSRAQGGLGAIRPRGQRFNRISGLPQTLRSADETARRSRVWHSWSCG